MTHTQRFTPHASAYVSGRPSYPAALGAVLRERGLFSSPVADIGAGTGLFTRLLLESGAQVSAVEPNAAMRAELERELSVFEQSSTLHVLPGTSEATRLDAASVGRISVAQAVHWFDPLPTLAEFRRILVPGGQLLLVRNELDREADEVTRSLYGGADRHSGMGGGRHSLSPEVLRTYFGDGPVEALSFSNPLPFTRERLHHLLGSLSAVPAPGTPEREALAALVNQAFDTHQQGGIITLNYQTQAYLGAL